MILIHFEVLYFVVYIIYKLFNIYRSTGNIIYIVLLLLNDFKLYFHYILKYICIYFSYYGVELFGYYYVINIQHHKIYYNTIVKS